MTNQKEFHDLLTDVIDAIAEFRNDAPYIPAIPSVTANELREQFDIGLPETGRAGAEIIQDLIKAATPGLAANTHPNFYAWVQGSSHPVGVAADMLTSGWGQNSAIYQTAPAAAIAEEISSKWLLDLLQLPAESSVAYVTGATTASFVCLSVARNEVLQAVDYDLDANGIFGAPTIHVLVGDEAHSTIFADLRYLGFGTKNLVKIKTDEQGRMDAADLARQIEHYDGPKILVLQAGHINSGAFDDFKHLIPTAKAAGAWVHVDGAFGLWANANPTLAHLCNGIEAADSWTVDGHKWLQVPYDCGFAIVRDEAAHKRAMSMAASYLVTSPDDGKNPSNYGMELSRRARGFAVWATLQALGRSGISEMVDRHCRCASHLAQRLAGEEGIHVLNEVVLNQVTIAFGMESPVNTQTNSVIDTIRAENEHFVLGAAWQGHVVLRVSIISRLTSMDDIDRLADSICRAWHQVSQS
jgi:glutamate/tyrosine decarboxylase-like PLP-dependent enzyme